MSHGVLAKLVTKLLDEKSQFPGSLGLLLQELITEAGNILLDFLQLTLKMQTHPDRWGVLTGEFTDVNENKKLSHKYDSGCYKTISMCPP